MNSLITPNQQLVLDEYEKTKDALGVEILKLGYNNGYVHSRADSFETETVGLLIWYIENFFEGKIKLKLGVNQHHKGRLTEGEKSLLKLNRAFHDYKTREELVSLLKDSKDCGFLVTDINLDMLSKLISDATSNFRVPVPHWHYTKIECQKDGLFITWIDNESYRFGPVGNRKTRAKVYFDGIIQIEDKSFDTLKSEVIANLTYLFDSTDRVFQVLVNGRFREVRHLAYAVD